jgi:hypothetical protein
MPFLDSNPPTVRHGCAPHHETGACRVLLSPAPVAGGRGPGSTGAVVVRHGRRDGTATRLYAGGALLTAAETVESAVERVAPRAVWLTDRSYVREHWPPWTVRTAERRLAAAADRSDARLIAWTGDPSS